jgi:hypothetical protein
MFWVFFFMHFGYKGKSFNILPVSKEILCVGVIHVISKTRKNVYYHVMMCFVCQYVQCARECPFDDNLNVHRSEIKSSANLTWSQFHCFCLSHRQYIPVVNFALCDNLCSLLCFPACLSQLGIIYLLPCLP